MKSFNEERLLARLNTPAYAFLKDDAHLGNNILMLTVAGSIAYGTDVATSDLDVRGVSVELKTDLMGLTHFEQFEDRTTDTVIFGLKKFIQLCLNSNPNALELLGTEPECVVKMNEEGELLRTSIDLFLSKKVIQSFGCYATAQLRRLQNALARDQYPQPEKEEHILQSIMSSMDHLKKTYGDMPGNGLNLFIDESSKEGMETEIFMDLNVKHYPLRDFKNIYASMSNVVKDYDKLQQRNRKKDDLHLNKHAMHLVRLLMTGIDILEGNGIRTYRTHERDLLLDIRHGCYTYDQLFEMADDYDARFHAAAQKTQLPDEPQYDKVQDLMIAIYEKYMC